MFEGRRMDKILPDHIRCVTFEIHNNNKKYDYGYGYEKTFGNDHLKLSKKKNYFATEGKKESFHYIDVIN